MKRPYYNLRIDVLDSTGFFEALRGDLTASRQVTVNFLNAHCFNLARHDRAYEHALNSGTYLLNDGIGVEIGARLLGFRFPENLNGTDLIPGILAHLAASGRSVFLFGARGPVIEGACTVLRQRLPALHIAGFADGYFERSEEVLGRIADSGAEAVIVGMGVPRQELWVAAHRDALPGVRLFVCGGAVFDFIAGAVSRAPPWMRRWGLEWLYRLLQEPRRLFGRYVAGNLRFLLTVCWLRLRSAGGAP